MYINYSRCVHNIFEKATLIGAILFKSTYEVLIKHEKSIKQHLVDYILQQKSFV